MPRKTYRRRYQKKKPVTKQTIRREILRTTPVQMTEETSSFSITTSLYAHKLLRDLLDVKLASSNQTTGNQLPLYNIPGEDYRRLKVHILGIHINGYVRGSQGNALVAADLFNNIRMRIIWSSNTYTESPTSITTAPTTLFSPFDDREVKKVYMDKLFYLPSISFDSSNYNVPTQRSFKKYIKINRVINCFSTTDADTTTTWDTQTGDLVLQAYSDSSVTPNPNLDYSVRLYYKYIL